jgi:hypothetical protein
MTDALKEYQRQYRLRNKQVLNEKARARWAARSEEDREAERVRSRQRHYDQGEKASERGKGYYQRNREKVLARQSAHQMQNRERATARVAEWRRANPEKVRSAKAAHYSRMKRIPPWADVQLIEDIYLYAKTMRACGVDVHVDHIVPLRGKLVSGLHTHDNLQVIPAKENMRKNAKLLEHLL